MLGRKNEESKETHEPEQKENIAMSTSFAMKSLEKTIQPTSPKDEKMSPAVLTIIDKLKNDKQYNELILTGMTLTTLEKKNIFNALAKNNTVTKANFTKIQFSLTDAQNFYDAFLATSNNTLNTVILNDNRIDASSLEWLLKTPLKLNKLVLMNNDIGDEGAALIASEASTQNIGLQQNKITTKGVDALLKSSKEFSQVTYQSLKMGNPFGHYQPLENRIAKLGQNITHTASASLKASK